MGQIIRNGITYGLDAKNILSSIEDCIKSEKENQVPSINVIKELDNNIESLKTNVENGKASIANTITSKGVSTAADATFQTMANNIVTVYNNAVTANKPTSATLNNQGALVVKNSAGTNVYSKTFTNTYDAGYSSGSTAGYNSGYSAGSTAGYNSGYSAGVSAGVASVNSNAYVFEKHGVNANTGWAKAYALDPSKKYTIFVTSCARAYNNNYGWTSPFAISSNGAVTVVVHGQVFDEVYTTRACYVVSSASTVTLSLGSIASTSDIYVCISGT